LFHQARERVLMITAPVIRRTAMTYQEAKRLFVQIMSELGYAGG
jgi:hypothetical protein